MKNTYTTKYTTKEVTNLAKAYIGVHSRVRKSEDEIAEIITEYLVNGRTIKDLETQYGSNVVALIKFVRAQMKEQGRRIEINGRGHSKISDEQIMLMYKDYSAGEKYKDLMKKYQIGSNTISRVFRDNGLPMKKDSSMEAVLAYARTRQANRLLNMEGITNPAIQIANTATENTFVQRRYKVRVIKKEMKKHARVSHEAMPKNIWWVG